MKVKELRKNPHNNNNKNILGSNYSIFANFRLKFNVLIKGRKRLIPWIRGVNLGYKLWKWPFPMGTNRPSRNLKRCFVSLIVAINMCLANSAEFKVDHLHILKIFFPASGFFIGWKRRKSLERAYRRRKDYFIYSSVITYLLETKLYNMLIHIHV